MNKQENANQPAFATASPQTESYDSYLQEGLTKREYFAGLAMQGILANSSSKVDLHHESKVSSAIKLADLLLEELSKQI